MKTASLTPAMRAALLVAARTPVDRFDARGTTLRALWVRGLVREAFTESRRVRGVSVYEATRAGLDALRAEVSSA